MTSSTIACQRPGCAGHYAADGYCDECGHKLPGQRPPTSGAGAGAVNPNSARFGAGTFGVATAGRPGLATGAVTGAGLGGTGSTGRSSRSRTAGRGRLGANLVAVPPVPLRDPASAVMKNPQVPESHRFCGKCGEPVGRGRDGKPGRVEGFCPRDRTKFSFRPKLNPGELVDDRYEILGALAHGGLGWIYLARDRNISQSGADRWVVLKGLINAGDPDALAAAVAERRFLVEVDHPNIVKIHDFAEHPDPDTGELVGYIVMEYVGGRSLKDLALKHVGPDGRRAPLPLEQVLAYGIEVLPALGYLHDRGLLFCDFKPDNVIHAEEQLKVIDLGAVRRIDDQTSPLWGTPGYQAPELATLGASVGLRHLHRRAYPGRAQLRLHRLLHEVRRFAAAGRRGAAAGRAGVVPPVPAPGHPPAAGAPVRLGHRNGRPGPRRAAGDPRGDRRGAPARHLHPVHPGAAHLRHGHQPGPTRTPPGRWRRPRPSRPRAPPLRPRRCGSRRPRRRR